MYSWCNGSTAVSKTVSRGSSPWGYASFRIATANIKNLFLKKSQKMLSCFICPFSIMVLHLFCNQVTAVRFCHGAPSFAVVVLWEGTGLSIQLRRVRFPSTAPSFESVSKYSHANEVSSKDQVSKRGRVRLPVDRLSGIDADGC